LIFEEWKRTPHQYKKECGIHFLQENLPAVRIPSRRPQLLWYYSKPFALGTGNSMKQRISIFLVAGLWLMIVSGCSGPPKITSFKLANNQQGTAAGTSFTVGDNIFAFASVSDSSEPLKVKFAVTAENVADVAKGTSLLAIIDHVQGDRRTVSNHLFGLNKPGEFRVEATLMDNADKVLDTKSSAFTLNPNPAANSDPGDGVNKALKTLEKLKTRSENENSK